MNCFSCYKKGVLYTVADNHLIICDEKIKIYQLPSIPDSFSYQKIWTDGRNFIIGWEEQDFPNIGRSGMIFFEISDRF